jgi:hypothetical protein
MCWYKTIRYRCTDVHSGQKNGLPWHQLRQLEHCDNGPCGKITGPERSRNVDYCCSLECCKKDIDYYHNKVCAVEDEYGIPIDGKPNQRDCDLHPEVPAEKVRDRLFGARRERKKYVQRHFSVCMLHLAIGEGLTNRRRIACGQNPRPVPVIEIPGLDFYTAPEAQEMSRVYNNLLNSAAIQADQQLYQQTVAGNAEQATATPNANQVTQAPPPQPYQTLNGPGSARAPEPAERRRR